MKVYVQFPDGTKYPYYFGCIPRLKEYIETKRALWRVVKVLHHASEPYPLDVPATITVTEAP